MVLYKLEDFDANYQGSFGGDDIKGYDVYSDRDDEKVGTVKNILVDESGHFRYLVVDTGFWILGKQVLLPVGRTRIDQGDRRVYAVGFTKEQAKDLPEFSEDLRIDYDYEELVRGVYRTEPLETSVPLEASAPLDAPAAPTPYKAPETEATPVAARNVDYDRNAYTYQQEPDLYQMNEQDHQTLKLYEERLVANKTRHKAGEVTIGKHVETETERVSVPVEKERVVIERVTPENAFQPVSPGEAAFRSGEVARMDIYEEKADIHKQAVLREEVRIRKQVEQEMVSSQEQVRREELDVDTESRPIVDKNR
ncbi:PRC-barrel domain-containing protein [Kalymmatonema gypsitolerans NIES-4073]|nr:PRC-barrel domain-containing protein [Scytonema sp. NIES-4073]